MLPFSKQMQSLIGMAIALGNYPDDVVCLHKLSETSGYSVSYLEQLFAKLKRAGAVFSVKGPGGGYSLAKPQITLYDLSIACQEDTAARFEDLEADFMNWAKEQVIVKAQNLPRSIAG